METQYNLNITSPCIENFNQFAPTRKGGFCNSCQKEVIDFTTMQKEDIITYFKTKTTENTCGRFNIQQLNQPNLKTEKNKYLSFFTGIGLIVLSFLSTLTTQAQEIEKPNKTLKTNSDIEELKDKSNIKVKGTVVTKEDGLPLPGASVYLLGTEVGVQTDFDGYFEFPIKLKKGDVLVISYVGLESKKIIIENKKSASIIELKLDMELDSYFIMGEVAVKEIFKSKKN